MGGGGGSKNVTWVLLLVISLVKVDKTCHMGGGVWGLKSAEKVSHIFWMAPYLYHYLGQWWNQYHKTDCCHSLEAQFGKKQLTDEKEKSSFTNQVLQLKFSLIDFWICWLFNLRSFKINFFASNFMLSKMHFSPLNNIFFSKIRLGAIQIIRDTFSTLFWLPPPPCDIFLTPSPPAPLVWHNKGFH